MWEIILFSIFLLLAFLYWKSKKKLPKLKDGEKRYVGNLGKYRVIRNELEMYYGYSIGVQLQSRESRELISSQIISATYRWYNYYECLSVVIDDVNSNNPKFIIKNDYNSTSNYPVEFVPRQDPRTIERVLISEHNRKWKLTKRLWRLIVILPPSNPPTGELLNFDLVFSSAHLISDGISGLALMEKFLQCYDEIKSNPPLPQAMKLTKSVEELVDVKPKLGFLIKTFVKKRILTKFLPVSKIEPLYFAGTKSVPLQDRMGCPTEGVFIEISEDTVKQIHKKARENNTTIHGCISAACVQALAKVVPPNYSVKLSSPVDLRTKIPYDHLQVGDWVAAIDAYYDPRLEPSFWNLARKIKHDIVQLLPEAIQLNGMLDYIDNWKEFWLSQQAVNPNGKSSTISVSNLGVCKWAREYGELRVNRCLFSQGYSSIGSLYQLSIVTSPIMTISLTYSSQLTTKNEVLEFVAEFKRIINTVNV